MFKKAVAIVALAFLLLAGAPALASEASGLQSPYASQLDENGRAVYDAVSALEGPYQGTRSVLVDLPMAVSMATREAAESYAVKTACDAAAAAYYGQPLNAWLWDLPVKELSVTASVAESGSRYVAESVSFDLSIPERYGAEGAVTADDAVKAVKEACADRTYSGDAAAKARSIARWLASVPHKDDAQGTVSNVHDAVCGKSSSTAGIAAAYVYVASLNGLDAVVVKGMSYKTGADGQVSYWNAVADGGKWYSVDVGTGYIMAGDGTKDGETTFRASHVEDLDLASANDLRAPALEYEGHQYPDDRPFLEKYGAYVVVALIVIVLVAVMFVGARNGSFRGYDKNILIKEQTLLMGSMRNEEKRREKVGNAR